MGALSAHVQRWAPGVLLAIVIALAAGFIVTRYGGPLLLLALLLGMAFNFLSTDPRLAPGLELCSRSVLRAGVALLGARITLAQIGDLGARVLLIVIGAIAATMLFSRIAGRWLRLPGAFAALSGTAVSICGVSAALTAASVLPKHQRSADHTAIVCIGVTALSTLAMLVYPLLASLTGFNATDGGVFLGATIHDVAQVVGAGYTMSIEHGDVATVTKLLRVLLLAPVVLALSVLLRSAGAARVAGGWRGLTPPAFLLAFIAIVALNSLAPLPSAVVSWSSSASQACLILAIAALGLKTSLASLREVGWRPLALMTAQTAFLAGVVCALLLIS